MTTTRCLGKGPISSLSHRKKLVQLCGLLFHPNFGEEYVKVNCQLESVRVKGQPARARW